MDTFAAVDLGASSGRVICGRVAADQLRLDEVARFGNEPVLLPDGLHWNAIGLYAHVVSGLRAAQASLRPGEALRGVGVDSWAIDYGLIDTSGALIGSPFSYRDQRTADAPAQLGTLDAAALYSITGLQHLPFTTLHQLAVEPTDRLAGAAGLLLIPDLLGFWLADTCVAELTNASTTGLLDVTTRQWSAEVLDQLHLPRAALAPLVAPGTALGQLRSHVQTDTGMGSTTTLFAVGSHDTASAVVGAPLVDDQCAYISCGTWGLVGVEIERPVLTEASRQANFTNELGVDGTVRYLRNVMGLWVLQQCEHGWERAGSSPGLAALLSQAASVPAGGPLIDIDQPVFLSPNGAGVADMAERVRDACVASDQRPPLSNAEVTRCVLDSLADAFARTLRDAAALSDRTIRTIHLVGGGARNALLCQLTADATGLPVVAGPVEATAIGNLLVQARSAGTIRGDLSTMRALVRSTHDLYTYLPSLRGER